MRGCFSRFGRGKTEGKMFYLCLYLTFLSVKEHVRLMFIHLLFWRGFLDEFISCRLLWVESVQEFKNGKKKKIIITFFSRLQFQFPLFTGFR